MINTVLFVNNKNINVKVIWSTINILINLFIGAAKRKRSKSIIGDVMAFFVIFFDVLFTKFANFQSWKKQTFCSHAIWFCKQLKTQQLGGGRFVLFEKKTVLHQKNYGIFVLS